MFKHPRRPFRKDIVPAAASFAVTFAAGMGFTLFELTGGFPGPRQDRPAFVLDEAAAPQLAAVVPPPVAAAPELPASDPAQDGPAEPDVVPLADASVARTPPPRTSIDTESLDSILARHAPAIAPLPAEEADGDAAPAQWEAAVPPEIVIDIPMPPPAYDVD